MTKILSMDCAARIWQSHREIEIAQKLLKDMREELKRGGDPNPRDVFGRRRQLSLGVPNGGSGERMLDVSPTLAINVMEAHIANKERELAEASVIARIELGLTPDESFEPL